VVGSTSFFLEKFEANYPQYLRQKSKCNLQLHERSLSMISNYSDKLSYIPFPFSEIKKVNFIYINCQTFFYDTFLNIITFGVSKIKARYFTKIFGEYSIEPMNLLIETLEAKIYLKANGFLC
jgi:hypothetical protein